ncbi:hypothetical protein [Blastopirellula marina]|uniref:Uncharacterized protein n=1 Tax=Blastopirellula marina TaxID=124 RepID=A0A2S8FAJ9_9BACT|nr:hypothetical protein [Blastopirellula marina]PQO28954.1 hypothetical protein C5Y98_24660 [Blastopirellula marina]PTL42227.1 hypothetical protein C5Y97_24675 [Blastopirellula marina]
MPNTTIPADWISVEASVLSIHLPQGLAKSGLLSDSSGIVLFAHQSDRVAVFPASESHPETDPLLIEAESIYPGDIQFTSPSLVYKVYETDPLAFSVSTDADDVRWLSFCLKHYPDLGWQTIESINRPDLDGTLRIKQNAAVFGWQSKDYPYSGKITFETKENQLDIESVRAICHSLRVENPSFQKNSDDSRSPMTDDTTSDTNTEITNR